ncbi:hypothetical protein B0H15DRAFT_787063 [Mycena belliarum]|uniref:BTB domain-containing protein n=1 Tax=Mycena belliarum TaxID=1033014 RepID=A0AAD6TX65_9AGAR|nr:hypothetical protein B0H15DRAFT_787063 [Mycena belliae]
MTIALVVQGGVGPTIAEPPPYLTAGALAPRRHEDYYFDDGTLVVLVSGTLFRLWDGAFRRHAPAFPRADKLTGSDDAHPLVLAGVECADFERLLWVVYPPVIGQCKAKTSADWTAVLDLATRWGCADVRALAIRELGALRCETAEMAAADKKTEKEPKMPAVEKIALAQRFDIPRAWARGAYEALCARNDSLELAEATMLGLETVVKVAFARCVGLLRVSWRKTTVDVLWSFALN